MVEASRETQRKPRKDVKKLKRSEDSNSKYHSFNELLNLVDQPNRARCFEFMENHGDLLKEAQGSKTNHQAWKGGYIDHLAETMNIAVVLYDSLDSRRPLAFSLSDSLLVLFLHDVEKPWKQQYKSLGLVNEAGVKDQVKIKEFREQVIRKAGFELTSEHRNALDYAEGEGSDYVNTRRVQLPLAAFVHMCDVWSARGWFNYPAVQNDPWKGAKMGI